MNRRSAPFRHLAVWLSLALSAIAFPSLVAAVEVEDAKSIVTPTAGIGLRLWALTLDIGAGYDFRFRQGLASFSLGATF